MTNKDINEIYFKNILSSAIGKYFDIISDNTGNNFLECMDWEEYNFTEDEKKALYECLDNHIENKNKNDK